MVENKSGKKYILLVFIVLALVVLSVLKSTSKVELPNDYSELTLKNYTKDDKLPSLDFTIIEGQGIPSIILKSPSEYSNKNPWLQNEKVEVLPVFINKEYNLKYHEGPLEHLSKEESIEVGLILAEKLGLDTNMYECIDNEAPYYIYFPNKEECEVRIEPSVKDVRIFIEDPSSKEIRADLPNIKEDDEQVLQEKYLFYFYQIYEDILKLDQPVFEVTYDYFFDGEKNYRYKIFNQEETIEETIINYNLNYIDFWIDTSDLDETPGLRIIDISYEHLLKSVDSKEYDNSIIEKLAEKNQLEILGYYPLISKEEAIDKVLNKDYVTTIDYDRDIDKSDILSIELVYYLGPTNKTIQPVYQVYLNLKDTIHDDLDIGDLEQYGLFYVPAIEEEYLNIH